MPGRPIDNEGHLRDKLFKRLAALEALSPVPGEIRAFALPAAPAGWLEANGAEILIADYQDLAAAMYCGDARNATADWGYRVTSGVRDIAGTHIVLPDYRGEFLRGWDNGRGKDPGRDLYSAQGHALNEHTHTGEANNAGSHNHTASSVSAGTPSGSIGGSGAHTHEVHYGQSGNTATTGGGANRVFELTDSAAETYTITSSGAHSHTFSGSALPAHSHTIAANGDHTHTLTIDPTGGTETRPANLAALICIKT